MARKPLSEEQKQRLRDNLERGRATAKANREAGIPRRRRGEAPPPSSVAPPSPVAAPLPVETRDFDGAVAKAVEEAIAARLPAMFAAIAQANGHAQGESPENFAKALALQMAKFTGQGVGKTYVDPEELEKRSTARRKMMDLLGELRLSGDIPAYRVIAQTQLPVGTLGPIVIEPLWRGADRIQHDTEIDWLSVPNLAMHPLNDSAKRVFALFETAIGAEMPEVGDPEGLDSPLAHMRPQLGLQALTPTGAVVRGAAAAAIIRNDPAMRDLGNQHQGPVSPYQAAVIRRGEDPAVRKKQVLGTLTDPIEMR